MLMQPGVHTGTMELMEAGNDRAPWRKQRVRAKVDGSYSSG